MTPRSRRLLRHGLVAVVAAAVVAGFVVALPSVRRAGATLVDAHPGWVVVAVACEAAALVAFSVLHHRLLVAAAVRVSFGTVTLATLAANALQLTVPGGPALATAYTFRRRRVWGASTPAATWTMVVGGIAMSLALAGIAFASALVVGGDPTSLPRLVLRIAAIVAVGAGVVLLVRRPRLLVTVGTWGLRAINRVRRRPRDTGVATLSDQIAALQLIELSGRGRVVVGAAALLKWVFDIACLAVCCLAVGARGVSLPLVLVAYAAATVASSVTLLPGGLGLIDGALVTALVAGGVPFSPALAAVLLYRLITFVGVAAAGWIAWFVVHGQEKPSAAAVEHETEDDDTRVGPDDDARHRAQPDRPGGEVPRCGTTGAGEDVPRGTS